MREAEHGAGSSRSRRSTSPALASPGPPSRPFAAPPHHPPLAQPLYRSRAENWTTSSEATLMMEAHASTAKASSLPRPMGNLGSYLPAECSARLSTHCEARSTAAAVEWGAGAHRDTVQLAGEARRGCEPGSGGRRLRRRSGVPSHWVGSRAPPHPLCSAPALAALHQALTDLQSRPVLPARPCWPTAHTPIF